jgi:hypothetical protein
MSAFCNACKEPVIDDREKPQGERQPCPKCGSLDKRFVVTATCTIPIAIQDYAGGLLDTAHRLAQDSQFEVATIVCHVACEFVVESAFTRAFAQNNLRHLEDPVLEFLNGFNLANERIRTLYTALTGDAIQNEPFWTEFTASAKRRNKCAHGSSPVVREVAQRSLEAAYAFVHHVRPFAGM